MNDICKLIGHWPTRQAFADAVGANVEAVHKWAKAGRIPSGWHHATVIAARTAGVTYATPDWIISVHALTSEQPPPVEGVK